MIETIRNNNMAGLREAVALGADVNTSDQFGQTVLVWAAYTGTTEMAELLIDAGADPNLGRNPPLHYAARFGRAAMVQVLALPPTATRCLEIFLSMPLCCIPVGCAGA